MYTPQKYFSVLVVTTRELARERKRERERKNRGGLRMCMKERNESAQRDTEREKEVVVWSRLSSRRKRERERASPVYFVFSCTMKILTLTHTLFTSHENREISPRALLSKVEDSTLIPHNFLKRKKEATDSHVFRRALTQEHTLTLKKLKRWPFLSARRPPISLATSSPRRVFPPPPWLRSTAKEWLGKK